MGGTPRPGRGSTTGPAPRRSGSGANTRQKPRAPERGEAGNERQIPKRPAQIQEAQAEEAPKIGATVRPTANGSPLDWSGYFKTEGFPSLSHSLGFESRAAHCLPSPTSTQRWRSTRPSGWPPRTLRRLRRLPPRVEQSRVFPTEASKTAASTCFAARLTRRIRDKFIINEYCRSKWPKGHNFK